VNVGAILDLLAPSGFGGAEVINFEKLPAKFHGVRTEGEAAALFAVGVHVTSALRSIVRVANGVHHHSVTITDVLALALDFPSEVSSAFTTGKHAALEGVGVEVKVILHAIAPAAGAEVDNVAAADALALAGAVQVEHPSEIDTIGVSKRESRALRHVGVQALALVGSGDGNKVHCVAVLDLAPAPAWFVLLFM